VRSEHGWLRDGREDVQGDDGRLLAGQTKALLEREVERSGITVFARPELVVEIALDGVQSSTRYLGGVALRFARVKRYRPDKNPHEADRIDDLRAAAGQDVTTAPSATTSSHASTRNAIVCSALCAINCSW
jgi:hypothetical protein